MVVHGDEHKDNSWDLLHNKFPVHEDYADYPPGSNLKLPLNDSTTRKVSCAYWAHDMDVPPWVWVAAAALVVALVVRRRRRRA